MAEAQQEPAGMSQLLRELEDSFQHDPQEEDTGRQLQLLLAFYDGHFVHAVHGEFSSKPMLDKLRKPNMQVKSNNLSLPAAHLGWSTEASYRKNFLNPHRMALRSFSFRLCAASSAFSLTLKSFGEICRGIHGEAWARAC
eukprot:1141446-Pelagomonas_calceolata.AAC.1